MRIKIKALNIFSISPEASRWGAPRGGEEQTKFEFVLLIGQIGSIEYIRQQIDGGQSLSTTIADLSPLH